MVSSSSPATPVPSPDPPNTVEPGPDLSPLAAMVSNIFATTSFHVRARCFELHVSPCTFCSIKLATRELRSRDPREDDCALMFPNTLAVLVEAVSHDHGHSGEVV